MSPEYQLSRSLIRHLRHALGTAPAAVLDEPWDSADQTAKLTLAASQHSMAVAVMPAWPVWEQEPGNTAGICRAQLHVAILATRNMGRESTGARLHNAAARVLAALESWADSACQGVPYAEPRVDAVADLDTSSYQDLSNLSGCTITITRPISLRHWNRANTTKS